MFCDQMNIRDPVPLQEVALVDLLLSSSDGEDFPEGRRSQLQGRWPLLVELAWHDHSHYQVRVISEPRKTNVKTLFNLCFWNQRHHAFHHNNRLMTCICSVGLQFWTWRALFEYCTHCWLTVWSRVLLEKQIGTQLLKKFPHFVGPEVLLSYSQEPTTGP